MDNQDQQAYSNRPLKVGLNPFRHFFKGNKDLFSTNAASAIVASFIAAALGFVIALLFSLLVASILKNLTIFDSSFGANSIVSLIGKLLAFWVLSSLITGYFYALVARTVLAGTRREHVRLGSLFGFVAKRYPIVLLVFLMVSGVYIAIVALIVLAAFIQPILAIVAGLAGFIFLLIFSFRMAYIGFIPIDNEKPRSARWVMRRSAQLWKKSGGALILYWLTVVAISIAVELLTQSGSNSLQSSSSASFSASPAINYGALAVTSLIEGALGLLVSAAVGSIYNQARLVVDGAGPAVGPSPVPNLPINPYLVAPAPNQPYPGYNATPPTPPTPQNYAGPIPQQSSQPQSGTPTQTYIPPSPSQPMAQEYPQPTPEQPQNNYPQFPQQPPASPGS